MSVMNNDLVVMKVVEEYLRQNPSSRVLYDRARGLLPGGSTRNVLYYPPFPLYMAAGKGSRIFDVDGNERIDFNFNNTTLILGHNHPRVLEAVREQLGRGTVLGAPSEVELKLAEELLGRLKEADLIRFTPSGTEANMQAIMLARCYTGKMRIAKFEGAYHGSWDTVDISVSPPLSLAGPDSEPRPVPQHDGIPRGVLENTIILPYNDPEASEALIKRHRDDLAAVIVEPVQRDIPPKPGFLQSIRELTERLGILLIFDEVISFRLSPGGAQRLYGVVPDITTLGKIIGGGFPVGAYASTEDVMEPLNIPRSEFPELKPSRLGYSGTFNAHPIAMAAGLAVMRELTPPTYKMLEGLGDAMREGLRRILEEEGIAAHVDGVGSLFNITWTGEKVVDYRTASSGDRALERIFSLDLMNRGVYLRAHPNVSTATTEKDIERALEAMRLSIKELRPIIQERAPNLIIR